MSLNHEIECKETKVLLKQKILFHIETKNIILQFLYAMKFINIIIMAVLKFHIMDIKNIKFIRIKLYTQL